MKTENKFEAHYYTGDEDDSVVKVKARDKKSDPKIMFARWGHMNPKRDKKKEREFAGSENPLAGFHTPPEKKGIYAFIWPYVEPFLAAWNKDIMVKGVDKSGNETMRFPPIKKFQHHGDIWTHFVEPAKKMGVGKEYKGSWVKVHTKDLPKLLKKVIAMDRKSLRTPSSWNKEAYKSKVFDPYKIGRSEAITMSRDHLEVFIPGKVRESK